MTDTVKATPGPWYIMRTPRNGIGEVKVYSSDMSLPVAAAKSWWARREEDANLIAEAGTVYHETGLTPRQLLEQRDELLHALMWNTAADAESGSQRSKGDTE